MDQEAACKMVWNILKAMPIEVFDDEEGSIWENDTYELVRPRTEGDFEGTRIIGSANLVTALNMLNQKLVINNVANIEINNTADLSFKLFAEVIEELQARKLIRKIPTKVRSTFKIIEGTNGTST
jgi:predicted transcriptional regulator